MGGEIFKVLGFISLGMAVSEFYNIAMWRKYREGLRNGNNAAEHHHYDSSAYRGGRVR